MGLKRSIHISLGSFSLNKVSQTLACTESPGNLILNCPFLGPPPPEILTRGLYRVGPGICILTTVPGGSAGAPGISPLRETRVSKPRPDYTQPWAPWKSASTHCGVPRGGRPESGEMRPDPSASGGSLHAGTTHRLRGNPRKAALFPQMICRGIIRAILQLGVQEKGKLSFLKEIH